MNLTVINSKNEVVGKTEAPESVFGVKWNPILVHQVYVSMLASRRHPLAHTKGRGEVRGGGKKPWRQKGTGRARAGSSRSPIWTGGGVTFGPNKERDYFKKINKKMKTKALLAVLSKKLKEGEVKILDEIIVNNAKTKIFSGVLKNILNKTKKNNPSVLFVASTGRKETIRAGRNIPKTLVTYPAGLNIVDCLEKKFVVFEKEALNQFITSRQK